MDTPAALKQRISGDALVDLRVRPENLELLVGALGALAGSPAIAVADEPPLKKITVRTKTPGDVMQLLAPYMRPSLILGLEVRSQTLEDVYVAIIQGKKA
jgi:hypothetical protein